VDDVEERASLNYTSIDLDIDPSVVIGLRFFVCVPVGATITESSLTLTAEGVDFGAASAEISAELSGDAPSFIANPTVTGRSQTTASETWALPVFLTGQVYESVDFSSVIAEVIAQPEWSGCGNIVLIVESTSGNRDAETFDGSQADAPVLNITYQP